MLNAKHGPFKTAGLWHPLTWRKVDAAEAWRQTVMKSAQWRKVTFKLKVLNDITCQLCAVCRKHVFTWYGKLATQTSKKGRSVFSTSPTNIWSLVCMGLLTNTKSFYPTALFIRLKLQWKLLPLLTCTELFSEVQPLICSPTHRLPPAKKQTTKKVLWQLTK